MVKTWVLFALCLLAQICSWIVISHVGTDHVDKLVNSLPGGKQGKFSWDYEAAIHVGETSARYAVVGWGIQLVVLCVFVFTVAKWDRCNLARSFQLVVLFSASIWIAIDLSSFVFFFD